MTRASVAWVVAAAVVSTPAGAQEVVSIPGDDVAIYDLAGHVEIIQGGGPEVVVRVLRGGDDADELRVETGEIDGRQTLRVIFPDDEIVYPAMGRGSSSSVRVRSNGTFGDGVILGDRVRIRGRGDGLEAWADLVVEMPAGRTLTAYVGVGELTATGVEGRLELDTGSGRVSASDVVGSLEIDTGSGRVDVSGVQGDVAIDTGSGRVDVSNVAGASVVVDTGSGRVTVNGARSSELRVDTGSGSVDLVGVSSPVVLVDTGSGSVELELLADVDRLDIDTGSGSVTVRGPEDLGGSVEIDTGSGGIDLDYAVTATVQRRDEVRGRLGDGDGSIRIDTGSGSVRVVPAR